MKRNLLTSIFAVVALMLMAPGAANAVPIGELGILQDTAINPATGLPFANGDTYRLIFASSVGRDATSSDINDYNGFIQNLANAAGLGAATWTAMASTETVAARDNTSTNVNVNGPGEAFFRMDGTTLVADNYADLYGSNTHSNVINQSETGGSPFDGGDFTSVWTGSDGAGRPKTNIGGNVPAFLGTVNGVGLQDGRSLTGLFNFTSGAHWIERFGIDNTQIKGLYGVSEVLTVGGGGVPEPATATLAMLGLGGLVMRRRRNAV